MPEVAWHYPADVKGLSMKQFNDTCNSTRARNFRRGYYAAVSYTGTISRVYICSSRFPMRIIMWFAV
jgi:hypothetical protein